VRCLSRRCSRAAGCVCECHGGRRTDRVSTVLRAVRRDGQAVPAVRVWLSGVWRGVWQTWGRRCRSARSRPRLRLRRCACSAGTRSTRRAKSSVRAAGRTTTRARCSSRPLTRRSECAPGDGAVVSPSPLDARRPRPALPRACLSIVCACVCVLARSRAQGCRGYASREAEVALEEGWRRVWPVDARAAAAVAAAAIVHVSRTPAQRARGAAQPRVRRGPGAVAGQGGGAFAARTHSRHAATLVVAQRVAPRVLRSGHTCCAVRERLAVGLWSLPPCCRVSLLLSRSLALTRSVSCLRSRNCLAFTFPFHQSLSSVPPSLRHSVTPSLAPPSTSLHALARLYRSLSLTTPGGPIALTRWRCR
jgi:hypothetical protein